MTARILDGKALAAKVRAEVAEKVAAFRATHGRAPALDVVLVGDDPASVTYTRSKERASNEVGIRGRLHALPQTASEREVVDRVQELADDDAVDAILVQLPLPAGIDPQRVTERVPFEKDVDGFHPMNVGLLALGRPALAPCTPLGCMRLLAETGMKLVGARAVVIGRSAIVGHPMAELLLLADATVTVAHLCTRDLPEVCREADVLVVAAGSPGLVRGSWIKPGAVVLDVGINRVAEGGGTRIVGDVAFDEAKEVAGFLTPVPGGVGPMTIAQLLESTWVAATRRAAARAT